jgi:hypothetical protein
MLDQRTRTHVTPLSPSSSYAIGPANPAQFTTLSVSFSDDEECALLVPVSLPHALQTDPPFQEGYEWGYVEGELDASSRQLDVLQPL